MPSPLTRLFTFARAAKARPLENFTTEALANAIRSDPDPFVDSLISSGLLSSSPGVVQADVVETQVQVPGGIVDLVVELSIGSERHALWFEIKAHAGVHGEQLPTYRAAAAQHPTAPTPQVLMLCKRPIAKGVDTLRWNTLRQAIDPATKNAYWRDFRLFLEEHRMADDYDHPITPDELAVAPTAHSLLLKSARLAHEFLASLPARGSWKAAEFPSSESRVVATMANQFRRFGRLVTHSKRYPWVNFGLLFDDKPRLEVWIEFQPTDFAARKAVFAKADASDLLKHWKRRESGWAWLGTSLPIDGEINQDTATGWLRGCFDELEAAGIFTELTNWRRKDRVGDDTTSSDNLPA